MVRIVLILFSIFVTSLFYFPFTFKFFPLFNTKLGLALVGLIIMGIQAAKGGKHVINGDSGKLSIYALVFSLFSFASVTINNTTDYAYATYLVSMWVWLSAAYAVCTFVRNIHGYLSICLIGKYLIAVCVIQCVSALVIDSNDSAKMLADSIIEQGQTFLNSYKVHRMYGLGASLDVAGIRFSIVLIIIAHILAHSANTTEKRYTFWYIASFLFISIVGNMIARTTSVGMCVAIVYFLFASNAFCFDVIFKNKHIWRWGTFLIVVSIPLLVYYYNTSTDFYKNLRFAFEGFFNYFEKGEWQVTSTQQLKAMYIFPKSIKTWIIGDGYFSNPINTDPYFIGEVMGGYYMGTDVGYLRFIFYSGLCGLISFSAFLLAVCKVCAIRFKNESLLMYMILVLGFAVWFKVSTDVFLAFALFLCVEKEEDEKYCHDILLTK